MLANHKTTAVTMGALVALLALQPSATASTVARTIDMAASAGSPHRRGVVVVDESRADAVMGNCSDRVTLTSECHDGSSAHFLYCVGSKSSRSCPRSPLVLKMQSVGDFDSFLDASGLGIDQVLIPSSRIGIDQIDLQHNRLSQAELTSNGFSHIQVAYNRFTSFEDLQYSPLLEYLNVSHNPISRLQLVHIDTQLRSLDATNCSLSQLDTTVAARLLFLVASRNEITSTDAITLGQPVRELDLSYNAIDDWRGFQPPRSLRKLNASHNTATRFVQGDWATLTPTLEVVDFSRNAITSISGVTWPTTLTHLDVSGNPIQFIEIDRSQLSIFTNLKTFAVPAEAASVSNSTCLERNAIAVRLPTSVAVCVATNDNDLGLSPDRSAASDSLAPTIDSNSPTTDADSSTSSWLVVVGAVVLLLVAVGAFIVRRRRAASHHHHTSTESSVVSSLRSAKVTRELEATRLNPVLSAFHIHATDAHQLQVIHETPTIRTCLVHVGELTMVRRQLGALVNERAALQLIHEIQCSAWLEHPRVVLFKGFTCTSAMDLAVYSEYMENGSVAAFLQRHRTAPTPRQELVWFPPTRELPTSKDQVQLSLLDIASAVAEAMVYLHSFDPPVVHGGIQAKHTLLDSRWQVKLARVGVRLQRANFDEEEPGAVAWLAPELLTDSDEESSHTPESDIYAFGVLLAELDSRGAQPFGHSLGTLTNSHLAKEIASRRLKPLFRTDCPSEIRAIAVSCLHHEPENRPTALKVSYELAQIRKRLGAN